MSERIGAARSPLVVVAAAAALPRGFWLQTGLFAMAAAIGAIGLTLLVGVTGQLSLGHAFFVAVGAYGYCYLAGGEAVPGLSGPAGPRAAAGARDGRRGRARRARRAALQPDRRPPARHLPRASRRSASCSSASTSCSTRPAITGGFNGRDAEPFAVAGVRVRRRRRADGARRPVRAARAAVVPRRSSCCVGAAWLARNIVAGRPGRALESVRDSEVAAASMGVDVRRAKAPRSACRRCTPAWPARCSRSPTAASCPDSFGFVLSIEFLVMVVLGGLGSIRGAIAGAFFVTALPQVLNHYSDSLPFVASRAPAHRPDAALAAALRRRDRRRPALRGPPHHSTTTTRLGGGDT